MKKLFSIILVICMAAGIFSVTAFAAEKDMEATDAFFAKMNICDFDANGKTDTEDAREVLKVAAGISAPAEGVNYDVNGDGYVSTLDALKALRIAVGIEKVISSEDILEYLTSELNWVKTRKPGFTGTETETCTSFTITCSGAPLLLNSLNAKDVEYTTWLKNNKTLLKLIMSDEEYQEMVDQANAAYEPQVYNRNVAEKSSSHFSYFPVKTCSWSCKLTVDDIKNVTYKINGNLITITVNMNNYTYADETYPGGRNQYSARQALPYGKAFNLPVLDGATTMDLKSGKIVCVIDSSTGGVVSADYSYSYVAQKAAEENIEDSNIKMSTKISVNIVEHYDINPIV